MRVATLLALVIGTPLLAADWPQWRGPNRDGISKETGLLQAWPKDGPKLVWQVSDVGAGYGAVAVAGDRIYLTANKGNDNEYVAAHNVSDGKQVWMTKLGKVDPNEGPKYPAARSTPTVDGERVYALGSDGDLVCVAAADGKEQWRKSLRKDFGGKTGNWAYSESPLIDGDVLVVTPGGADATLVALNKKSGELIWKAPVPGGDAAGYASVVTTEVAGVKQYIQFMGKGVVGVDAKTGKFLWRFDDTGKGPANMPTPVAAEGLVYTTGGRPPVGGLVKLVSTGGDVKAEKVYVERDLPTSIGGQVLVKGHLYGTTPNSLVCIEFATGKVAWKESSVSASSVLFADGRLYLHGEDGKVVMTDANSEKYVEKGRFTPSDRPKAVNQRERAWAYPALADGKLYIREHGVLWCYDVKGN